MGSSRVPVSEVGWRDAGPCLSSIARSAALSLVEPYDFGLPFSTFKYCACAEVSHWAVFGLSNFNGPRPSPNYCGGYFRWTPPSVVPIVITARRPSEGSHCIASIPCAAASGVAAYGGTREGRTANRRAPRVPHCPLHKLGACLGPGMDIPATVDVGAPLWSPELHAEYLPHSRKNYN